MGNQRQFNSSGGFSQYLYADVTSAVTINGITAKVIRKITDPTGIHDGLPTYANTSDMYFKLGENGLASQAKVYTDRKMVLDFDWNHNHQNSDGTKFSKGTVHVQVYSVGKNGEITRLSKNARLMTETEIAKFGPVIHHFNPSVRFN